MLEKRLLAMLTICLIVAGSVGRFAPGALGLVLAHCCCGPHDAADACHCPDCPSAHPQEGDAQDRDDASGDSPTMGTCTLEQVLARVPAASPTVTTSVVNVVAWRTSMPAPVIDLPAPITAPASARLDEPPRIT